MEINHVLKCLQNELSYITSKKSMQKVSTLTKRVRVIRKAEIDVKSLS